MKYFLLPWILLALFSSPVWGQRGLDIEKLPGSSEGQEISQGKRYAFLIGINRYLHWHELKTAVNDVRELRRLLLERYGFAKEDIYEFYDAYWVTKLGKQAERYNENLHEATRGKILDELRELIRRLGEKDSLLIYFAGHGHLDSFTKKGSWIPVKAERKSSQWIKNGDIRDLLAVSKARHILLVSDSCFAGGFFKNKRSALPEPKKGRTALLKAYEKISRQAITSGGLEPVSDEGFQDHSVFAYFFLDKLKENKEPFLLASEVFMHTRDGVLNNASQLPVLGELSNTGGQRGGEYLFFLEEDYQEEISEEERRLRELERMAAEQSKEESQIREKEEENKKYLAELRAKIKGLQKKLGTTGKGKMADLDALVRLVEERKRADERRKELEKQRQAAILEQQKRQEEIKKARIAAVQQKLQQGLVKYKKVTQSRFGKDLKEKAWDFLITLAPKWWRAEEVPRHEVATLLQAPEERKLLEIWLEGPTKLEPSEWGEFTVRVSNKSARSKKNFYVLNKVSSGMSYGSRKRGKVIGWRIRELGGGEERRFVFRVKGEQEGAEKSVAVIKSREGIEARTVVRVDIIKEFPGFTYLRTRSYSAGGQSYSVREYRHEKTGMEFVLVPGGSFMMGSEEGDDDEKPVHRVEVKEFLMAKYEVTQGVWYKIMGTKPWKGKSYVKEGENYAASYVSWEAAKEFCKKTGLRLPSESEWEYGCRSGTQSKYYWGEEMDGDYAWYDGNEDSKGEDYAHKVGEKKPNAYGLYDMSGNVREWCEDSYVDNYKNHPTDGSFYYTDSSSPRVNRGGSWSLNAQGCRSADRFRFTPGFRIFLGFRCSASP